MATCCRASSRRSPICAPTNTAARSPTACAIRSKSSGRARGVAGGPADVGAHLRARLGRGRHHARRRGRDRARVQGRGRGHDRLLVGPGEPKAEPVFGRMFQTPFADRMRNEAGIATIAVGAISEADHVNSIIAAGRADLCAIARPHLANASWTLMEAAKIGYIDLPWPRQYRTAKLQLERNVEREKARAQATGSRRRAGQRAAGERPGAACGRHRRPRAASAPRSRRRCRGRCAASRCWGAMRHALTSLAGSLPATACCVEADVARRGRGRPRVRARSRAVRTGYVLVNNAGQAETAPFAKMTTRALAAACSRVNLTGTFRLLAGRAARHARARAAGASSTSRARRRCAATDTVRRTPRRSTACSA